jgi:hypothetical protein
VRGPKKRLSVGPLAPTKIPPPQPFVLCTKRPCSFARALLTELYLFRCRAAIKILHEYFSSHREQRRRRRTLCSLVVAVRRDHYTHGPVPAKSCLNFFITLSLAAASEREGKNQYSLHTQGFGLAHCYAPSTPHRFCYALSANLI